MAGNSIPRRGCRYGLLTSGASRMLGAGGASRMLGAVASGCRLAVTRGAASLSREFRGVRTMPPWTTRTVTMASRHVKVEDALCWGPSLPVRSGRLCHVRGGYVRGFSNQGGLSDYEMDMLEKHMEQKCSGPRDTQARRERVLALSQYLQNELGAQPEEAWGILNNRSGKKLLSSPLSTIRGSVEYLIDEIGWSSEQTLDVFHRQPDLFQYSVGSIAERLTVLQKHFDVGRKHMGGWLATRLTMLAAAHLEAKLDFYLNTVGMTREALMMCNTTAFSLSLNDRIRPRYQFVTQMEERTGLRAGSSPFSYWAYSSRNFDRFLARDFGPGAVVEFAEFRQQYDVEHRPEMRDIAMNDYEREMIEGYCRTHHSVGRDSIERRERLLNLSRYLQDELGAGEEEAWGIVLNNGFVGSRRLVQARFDTIRGCVEHLKNKEGWSAAQILRAVKRDASVFQHKAESLAERMRVIQDRLELTAEEAASWLEERPYLMRTSQLEERLAYYMDRVGLSKDDLMTGTASLYRGSLVGTITPRFEFVKRMEERRGWRVKAVSRTYLSYNRVLFERMLRREFGEDALSEYEAFHAERMKGLRGRG